MSRQPNHHWSAHFFFHQPKKKVETLIMAKTALDNSKNRLSGKNGEFFSKFYIATRGNNPQFVVDTNNPANKNESGNWGKFSAPSTPVDVNAFLEHLRNIIDGPNEKRIQLQLSDQPYINKVKSRDIIAMMNLAVGKDAKGIIYIEAEDLSSTRYGKHRFYFAPPDRRYISTRSGANDEISPAEVNRVYANSWLRFWTHQINTALVTCYVDSFSQPRSGGGGGNNFPARKPAPQSGGDEYMNSDDIPF